MTSKINSFVTNVAYFNTDQGDKILYPFSPPIFQTEVDENFTNTLLEEGRKLNIKEDDWNNKLAGNLIYGRSYKYKQDMTDKAEAYIKVYVERFFNGLIQRFGVDSNVDTLLRKTDDREQNRQGKLKLDTIWVNFSKKHDFNPPHSHSGILSFVIFLKVPKEIFKVQADSNSKQAGKIVFTFGDQISKIQGSEYPIAPYKNLMLIFPANLRHFVPPYWVDEERISVSGNFIIV